MMVIQKSVIGNEVENKFKDMRTFLDQCQNFTPVIVLGYFTMIREAT